jgi:hypothetical protein
LKGLINFNFSELEQLIWDAVQETFQQAMVEILSMLDLYLMSKRDPDRYELKEIKKRNYITMVGPIEINRRYYWDRHEKKWVYLLDQVLDLAPREQISTCLKELVVLWATKGPSYRDARDRLKDLFGYQVVSHEKIRHVLIQASETLRKRIIEKPTKKRVRLLFFEADGLWTGVQHRGRKTKRKRETHLVVVHEGWEIRQGSGDKADYRLKNPMYITMLANSKEEIWEQVMLRLLEKYENLNKTQFVINGDLAPWIRRGTEYFRKAIYQYDRFHLKREVKQMLNTSKEYVAQALDYIDQNNPEGLFETIGKAAEKTKCMDKKQKLLGFKWNLQKHADALVDYRQRLKRQGVDVSPSWRGMGAAESNVDLFKLRTAKRGRSWSERGIKAIFHMLGLLYENVLHNSIKQLDLSLNEDVDAREFIAMSAGKVAKTVGREAIGVPRAGFPAIHRGNSQGFAKLFRGILNPCLVE